MSDLLGPLLGMSPMVRIWTAVEFTPSPNLSDRIENVPSLSKGIHWTSTGGKTWRLVIIR